MPKLVRLKPYDPKRGHYIRKYTTATTTFEESRGWYRVPDHLADYLATVHQLSEDPDSPLAFDVCSQEQAEAIDAAEKKKAEERARAAEPNVATARDVPGLGPDLSTEDLKNPGRRSRAATTGGKT